VAVAAPADKAAAVVVAVVVVVAAAAVVVVAAAVRADPAAAVVVAVPGAVVWAAAAAAAAADFSPQARTARTARGAPTAEPVVADRPRVTRRFIPASASLANPDSKASTARMVWSDFPALTARMDFPAPWVLPGAAR
jgi:hypothetical protein